MFKQIKNSTGNVVIIINGVKYEYDIKNAMFRLLMILVVVAVTVAVMTGWVTSGGIITTILGLIFGAGVIALLTLALPMTVLPLAFGKGEAVEMEKTNQH